VVGESISVSVDRNWYDLNGTVRILFTNNLSESVWLDGCSPYVVEGRPLVNGKLVSDWAVVCMRTCGTEEIAGKVRPFSSMEYNLPAFTFSGEMRVSMDYYTGCGDDRPISYAKCANTSAIKSGAFVIAA
jgi:hypothetical protein